MAEMKRISTTRNGDVLCTGRAFILDSFLLQGKEKKQFVSGNGSYIARFDKDGKVLWRHIIAPIMQNGKLRTNVIYDIKEAPDGSIITGGLITRAEDTITYVQDAWLMKLSPDGCLDDDCTHVDTYLDLPGSYVSVGDVKVSLPLIVYPNPGNHTLTVSVSDRVVYPLRYQLHSVTGQQVMTGTMTTPDYTSVDTDWLPAGMYIIAVTDKQGKNGTAKWVKQ